MSRRLLQLIRASHEIPDGFHHAAVEEQQVRHGDVESEELVPALERGLERHSRAQVLRLPAEGVEEPQLAALGREVLRRGHRRRL